MPGPLSIAVVVLAAVSAGVFQVLRPSLKVAGVWRENLPFNNGNCDAVPELQGFEKSILDDQSGLLYLACTPPVQIQHWMPPLGHLNVSGKTEKGYFATYDVHSGKITRLQIVHSKLSRGLSTHGMDVVRSSSNPSEIFVYAVNHRVPLIGDARKVGASSVIEIFKGKAGETTLVHLATVEHPLIHTPNDIVGSPDGKSFWFTNDYGSKTSKLYRSLEFAARLRTTSVGYCHLEQGCKIAADQLVGNNGIAKSRQNDTFYVASSSQGTISVFEKQSDNTLVLTDVIPTGIALDNISVDADGALWVAAFPKGLKILQAGGDLRVLIPAAAFRITQNTNSDAYFGEKYRVERLFEDDGTLISMVTSAVHDTARSLLYLHGAGSSELLICRV